MKIMAEKITGLPFVCISLHPAWGHKVVGELLNGSKVRAEYCEELFNAALTVDAIDGPGAWRRDFGPDKPEQLEVMAIAERLYGCSLADALPRWLNMPRSEYFKWENRPRVLWAGASVVQ